MNALDFTFFREGYFSLIWYIVAYLRRLTRNERSMGEYKG